MSYKFIKIKSTIENTIFTKFDFVYNNVWKFDQTNNNLGLTLFL